MTIVKKMLSLIFMNFLNFKVTQPLIGKTRGLSQSKKVLLSESSIRSRMLYRMIRKFQTALDP